jgi:hypothetical protein
MFLLAHSRLIRRCPPTSAPYPPAEDGQQAAGASGAGAQQQQQQQGQQQRLSDYVLPACDSKALCAYLDLFRCCSLPAPTVLFLLQLAYCLMAWRLGACLICIWA